MVYNLAYRLAGSSEEAADLTQEVRLASTGKRRLEWLIGGFFSPIAKITGLNDEGSGLPAKCQATSN